MPKTMPRSRKSGEPRTVCQHYRVTTTYNSVGDAIVECVDCGHVVKEKLDKPHNWHLR
jgi:uncharacterized Zn finger protein